MSGLNFADWASAGMQAGGNIATNIFTGLFNNSMSRVNMQWANKHGYLPTYEEQLSGQERLMQYQQALNQDNYKFQIGMTGEKIAALERAGLNKAVLAGGAGSSGLSASFGGSSLGSAGYSGHVPQTAPISSVDFAALVNQTKVANSQANLNDAEAERIRRTTPDAGQYSEQFGEQTKLIRTQQDWYKSQMSLNSVLEDMYEANAGNARAQEAVHRVEYLQKRAEHDAKSNTFTYYKKDENGNLVKQSATGYMLQYLNAANEVTESGAVAAMSLTQQEQYERELNAHLEAVLAQAFRDRQAGNLDAQKAVMQDILNEYEQDVKADKKLANKEEQLARIQQSRRIVDRTYPGSKAEQAVMWINCLSNLFHGASSGVSAGASAARAISYGAKVAATIAPK